MRRREKEAAFVFCMTDPSTCHPSVRVRPRRPSASDFLSISLNGRQWLKGRLRDCVTRIAGWHCPSASLRNMPAAAMSCPAPAPASGGGCHSHKNLSDRPIASDLNLSFLLFLSDPTKDSDLAASHPFPLALASLTNHSFLRNHVGSEFLGESFLPSRPLSLRPVSMRVALFAAHSTSLLLLARSVMLRQFSE